jgi:hypothetical protein
MGDRMTPDSNSNAPATPCWTPARTLLLPIAATAWPPLAAELALDGVAFVRKRELHATIAGNALGARLCDAMAASSEVRATVERTLAGLDWRWQRNRDWRLLEMREGGSWRRSVIELIALPAMAGFHHAMARLLGATLPVPPPHVTLYTSGGARGIGLPDAAALARLQLRTVDASELGLQPDRA